MKKTRVNCILACVETENVAWLYWRMFNERSWGLEFVCSELQLRPLLPIVSDAVLIDITVVVRWYIIYVNAKIACSLVAVF